MINNNFIYIKISINNLKDVKDNNWSAFIKR